MAIDGISRIEAVVVPAFGSQAAVVTRSRFPDKTQAADTVEVDGRPTPGRSIKGKEHEAEAFQIRPKADLGDTLGQTETYVRIRYDENRRTYLIEVRDASNDEVIREIPPDMWDGSNRSISLPTGMIVEKEQ